MFPLSFKLYICFLPCVGSSRQLCRGSTGGTSLVKQRRCPMELYNVIAIAPAGPSGRRQPGHSSHLCGGYRRYQWSSYFSNSPSSCPPFTPSPVPLPSPPQTPLPRSHFPHSPSPPPPAVITDGPGHHTAAQEDSGLEKPPRRRLQTRHKLLRRVFFPVVETTATIVVALPTVAFLRKALIWLQLFQMLGIAQETWAVAASDASCMTQPTAAPDAQPESVQTSPRQPSIWPGRNASPGHDRWCPCMAACTHSSHLTLGEGWETSLPLTLQPKPPLRLCGFYHR